MLLVKKKIHQAMSTNWMFMSIHVFLVSFFVNFGHISHRFLVFLLVLNLKRYIPTGNKIVSL